MKAVLKYLLIDVTMVWVSYDSGSQKMVKTDHCH